MGGEEEEGVDGRGGMEGGESGGEEGGKERSGVDM